MKKHRISLHFSWPDENLAVKGDPGAVRQAFLNLTINALEAMEHGGDLSIRLSREGTTCRAEIQDSGPGIPRDYLDQIFDPFFTTKPDGTGLGLPIADQTIRGQGGEIRVESSPEGSTFTVMLPLMKEEEA
jgi:signal transduction histidine kinase